MGTAMTYRGPSVTFPKYGTASGGTSTADLAAADRASIAYLFNPNPSFNEVDSLAAERAVASGTPGSGFAANGQLRLRDSERINRAQIGHSLLDPYLQREAQAASQTQSESARLNEIAAQGQNAEKLLQLQQSGQMTLQSDAQRAELERQVLAGTQAMERLGVQESGETSRLNTSIAGNLNLANTNNAASLERQIVGGSFDLAAKYGAGTPGRGADGRNAPVGASGLPVDRAVDYNNIGSSTKPFGMGTPQGFPGPSGPTRSIPQSYSTGGGSTVGIGASPLASSATAVVDRILATYGLA